MDHPFRTGSGDGQQGQLVYNRRTRNQQDVPESEVHNNGSGVDGGAGLEGGSGGQQPPRPPSPQPCPPPPPNPMDFLSQLMAKAID